MRRGGRLPECVAVLLLAASSAGAATFRKGPYLVYPNDPTKMTVLWQADSTPATGSYVEWGATTAYGSDSGALAESGAGADEHQFSHTIATLTPGARYCYRVHVDGSAESGSFIAGPDAAASAVSFYGYGDTRTNPDIHDAVLAALVSDVDDAPGWRGTMCLHVGDWVASGDAEGDWDGQYFDRTRPNALEFMSRLALMGCRGNHEGGAALLRKYLPYAYQDGTGCYYSFDYGPVHVTVVDQYVAYSSPSTQYTWIANDLAATSKTWKIVLWHEAAWCAGTGHPNNATAQSLDALFEAQGVAVVLCGHNHNYAHCEVNGVHHVTSGAGGAPLHSVDLGYPNVVAAESAYHFCRFDVSGNRMAVTMVRSSDSSVFESFEITKGVDATPPSVVGVTASGDASTVKVVFSERVEVGAGAGGAENTSNYSLPGFTVTGAALDGVGMTATLTVSPDMTSGPVYTLTVSGVADRAGIAMAGPQDVDFTFVPGPATVFDVGDVWKYWKGTADPGAAWNTPGFDDSGWLEGPTGIGYGDSDDATVLGDMQNVYTTVFMRRAFTVADPSDVAGLVFTVDYDDGFAAYVNGTAVASRNAPATITNSSIATASREAGAAEAIDITSAAAPALQAGMNTFAIVLLNVSLASTDASLIPRLEMTLVPSDPGSLEFAAATWSCVEGVGSVTITVRRTGGSDGEVTVGYSTGDGTASSASDEDYTSAASTLSWGDGDSADKSFGVVVTNDLVSEPAETVLLALASPTGGATLGTAAATLTILDDDDAGPDPASVSTPTDGATVSGIVNVAGTALDDWTVAGVEVSIGGGPFEPAVGTDDWTFAWDTRTVANGAVTVTVRVTDDNGHSTDTSVTVTVSNQATGGSGGGCGGTGPAGGGPAPGAAWNAVHLALAALLLAAGRGTVRRFARPR